MLVSALVIAIITQIPFIHRYAKLLNTFIHEVVGHALFSILSFGGVRKVKLNADTSGYAIVSSTWWGGRIITTFAGYPAASLFPSFMIYLLHKGYTKPVIWILTVLLCLAVLLWLRDILSLAWGIPLICGFILAIKYNINLEWPLFILMTIILIDSVTSSIVVAKLSFLNPRAAGDATDLNDLTLIPAQVWGVIFLLISVVATGYTFLVLAGLAPDYYAGVVDVGITINQLAGKYLSIPFKLLE